MKKKDTHLHEKKSDLHEKSEIFKENVSLNKD